jgi:arginyl-tRNA synthetase
MSSRTGDVITAEWLINELKNEIENLIQKTGEFNQNEIENIKEKVAIGAIKFVMLAANSKSDITFDIKKAIKLDGDSGPYIQYAYARIQSILRRIGNREDLKMKNLSLAVIEDEKLNFEILNDKDFSLIRKFLDFETAIKNATLNYSPHFICHYLLELTAEFSSWYSVNRVIDEKEELRNARLQILKALSMILKNGLFLLGIDTLEKM